MGPGSVLQKQSPSLEEVLAVAPVMNGWDAIQREGEPVLRLLENLFGTRGRKENAPHE